MIRRYDYEVNLSFDPGDSFDYLYGHQVILLSKLKQSSMSSPTFSDCINFDDEDFQLFLADEDQDLVNINTTLMSVVVSDSSKKKKKMSNDPSDPDNITIVDDCDMTSGGERVKTDRRNANKKFAVRECLNQNDRKRFADSMLVDSISIPTVRLYDERLLSTSRISDELLRCGSQARGLSTIVMSRASLAANISFAMFEAHGVSLTNNMTVFEKVAHVVRLVGHVMPIFGQIRKPPSTGLGDKSKIYQNHRPITDEYHSFAFEPVIISTSGDVPGDSGEIVAQGIIVSNKGMNFPVGDVRRVSLGRKAEFEESLCWVLITHVYVEAITTYSAIGPPATKKRGDAYEIVQTTHRNLYEDIFRWEAFMKDKTHLRGCGVSLFGFTDTKQTGKDIARRLVPWSIEHASETLAWFRENDKMNKFLIEAEMTSVKRASGRVDIPTGMDMRRFLLLEFLLVGTPLEPMLRNERVTFAFPAPSIPDGGSGLYRRLHDFCCRKQDNTM